MVDKRTLESYQRKLLEIEQLKEGIVRLESALLSPSLSNWSGMPRSPRHIKDKMAEGVCKLVDRIHEYEKQMSLLALRCSEIERAIAVLDDADRIILRARYILGHTVEQVAEDNNYSVRQTYRLFRKAIQHIEKDGS